MLIELSKAPKSPEQKVGYPEPNWSRNINCLAQVDGCGSWHFSHAKHHTAPYSSIQLHILENWIQNWIQNWLNRVRKLWPQLQLQLQDNRNCLLHSAPDMRHSYYYSSEAALTRPACSTMMKCLRSKSLAMCMWMPQTAIAICVARCLSIWGFREIKPKRKSIQIIHIYIRSKKSVMLVILVFWFLIYLVLRC